MGRAIVRKPKLFLMDEPLSNLDAKLRESMRTELVSIHRMLGTTTVYVTHDQLEAMTMATKIVLMNNQIIQQVGKPEEFYDKPQNLFVAKFIGTPTMNVLLGKLVDKEFVSNDNGYKIKLTDQEIKLINEEQNNSIYLGVRSEELEIVKEKGHMSLRVINVELLGMSKQIVCEIKPDVNVIITAPKDTAVEIGQKIELRVKNYHLFSELTEKRIG
ncbi:Multiple sugar-binding transport ATP-binding protein MsmK [Spiroplasma clarkii]|nr:Multiple sugar-binding transport ATP-binding protein MsmK [Spiroplasma clarkii]